MRTSSGWSPRSWIATGAFVFGVASSAIAQAPLAEPHSSAPRRGRILGVYDEMSGEPLEGVRVLDIVAGNSALTTSTGSVDLAYLSEGRTLIRLQKPAYQPMTMFINIGPDDTLPLTLVLQRVTLLPAVTTNAAATKHISPNLRGFEERRANGQGYFIDDSTLRKNENTTLGNLLAGRVPSIQLRPTGHTTQVLSNRMAMNGSGCLVDVYVDGVLVYTNAGPTGNGKSALGDTATARSMRTVAPLAQKAINAANQTASDINQYLVSDLAGVEFHDVSDMPIEFAHTSGGCGALILWTRER